MLFVNLGIISCFARLLVEVNLLKICMLTHAFLNHDIDIIINKIRPLKSVVFLTPIQWNFPYS